VHFQKICIEPGLIGVSRKPAGDHKPGVRVDLKSRFDPSGNLAPLVRIRNLIQPVKEKEKVPAIQKPTSETFGRIQEGVAELLLHKGIQAAVGVFKLPDR
jgi:hypothetical protein